MGYVYLIGETGNDGRYKIGSTRAKKIETRLKQLQTGNSSELSKDDTEAFRSICEEKMKVIDSLKDNPFYFNARIVPMKANFDLKNSNGRVYDQDMMKRLIEDYNFRLKEYGDVLGELTHKNLEF